MSDIFEKEHAAFEAQIAQSRMKFERDSRIASVVAICFFIVLFSVAFHFLSKINSEVEACGGPAKCLGKSVRDFNEAREAKP